MAVGAGFNPAFAMLQLAVYAAWLIFLSWKVSEIVRAGIVPIRAALCVAISVVISWTPVFVRRMFDVDPVSTDPLTLDYLAVQLGAPLAAFAWLWWWLNRNSSDDQDLAKVFE